MFNLFLTWRSCHAFFGRVTFAVVFKMFGYFYCLRFLRSRDGFTRRDCTNVDIESSSLAQLFRCLPTWRRRDVNVEPTSGLGQSSALTRDRRGAPSSHNWGQTIHQTYSLPVLIPTALLAPPAGGQQCHNRLSIRSILQPQDEMFKWGEEKEKEGELTVLHDGGDSGLPARLTSEIWAQTQRLKSTRTQNFIIIV